MEEQKQKIKKAVALVLDLARAFERVSFPVGDTLQFPKEGIAGALRLFRAPKEGAVWRMCARARANHHGHFVRIPLELLAFAFCAAGCTE